VDTRVTLPDSAGVTQVEVMVLGGGHESDTPSVTANSAKTSKAILRDSCDCDCYITLVSTSLNHYLYLCDTSTVIVPLVCPSLSHCIVTLVRTSIELRGVAESL